MLTAISEEPLYPLTLDQGRTVFGFPLRSLMDRKHKKYVWPDTETRPFIETLLDMVYLFSLLTLNTVNMNIEKPLYSGMAL